jgi:hypothetical protein
MNDSGWGCAYRSLQTLCSWMVLQGFTAKPIPTLPEIQRILVELGVQFLFFILLYWFALLIFFLQDKEKKFIGSTEWIGSQEVFLCLDHLYGVCYLKMNYYLIN